jgi:hypothetical protein
MALLLKQHVDYHLSFADQEKKLLFSVCRKQTKVCHFCFLFAANECKFPLKIKLWFPWNILRSFYFKQNIISCTAKKLLCILYVSFSNISDSASLNEDTGQNPRRHVVLIKTSQMRTICTQIWRESCLLVYVFLSASLLGVVDFCRYVFYLINQHSWAQDLWRV